jgi:hypothetical protein
MPLQACPLWSDGKLVEEAAALMVSVGMLRRSSEQFSAGYLYRAACFHPMSVVLLVIVYCAWFCSQDTFLTRYLSKWHL